MTALTNIMDATGGAKPITMSSLEIAELCGKQHKHVMRDIRQVLEELAQPKSGPGEFEGTYRDANGVERPCFNLPRRECMIVVAGYSVPLRARIIDRWEDLEKIVRDPAQLLAQALSDPVQARALLIDQVERNADLSGQIASMKPQVEVFDRIANADGSLSVTEAAKALQMRPKDLFSYLAHHGWIYKRAGGSHWLGYQTKVTSGLLEHKVTTVLRPDGTEKVTEQVRVTPKGLTKLAALIKPALAAA